MGRSANLSSVPIAQNLREIESDEPDDVLED